MQGGKVKFSVIRYGNIVGSRGSVIPFFLELKQQKITEFPIADLNMACFWITLEQGVDLVLKSLSESIGGEVFVPNIPSMKITDLAKAIDSECKFKVIGIRPREKIHETLISEDEARKTKEFNGIYVILPQFFESADVYKKYDHFPFVHKGFIYKSDRNDKWLTLEDLQGIINRL